MCNNKKIYLFIRSQNETKPASPSEPIERKFVDILVGKSPDDDKGDIILDMCVKGVKKFLGVKKLPEDGFLKLTLEITGTEMVDFRGAKAVNKSVKGRKR